MSEKLNDEEIAKRLAALPDWEVCEGELKRVFKFPDYLAGVAFASRCGEVAEAMNHHPDLLIQWRKVTVTISTHSAGGLTDLDFDYAAKVGA